ncbi:MAG: hypothetical protein QOF31_3894 [Mycobacterium sp.]|nr:hypothetical protein [Mycobacterium sp.]
MTSADPTPTTAALGIQPTYSAREAAVLLGRSYIWFDQRLREDKFIRPDGTTVQPLRRQGGYRQFTLAMLEDIALSSYRHHWFSMTKLKWTYCELLMAAYRQTGEYKFGLPPLLSNPVAPDTGSARADVADNLNGTIERNPADNLNGKQQTTSTGTQQTTSTGTSSGTRQTTSTGTSSGTHQSASRGPTSGTRQTVRGDADRPSTHSADGFAGAARGSER